MAALLAAAALPAGAGRVVVVDDDPLRDKPRRRHDPEPLYREPIPGRRLSRFDAMAAFTTSPADQARFAAAEERRERRRLRNLRAAGGKA
jgi:hypothetical protein